MGDVEVGGEVIGVGWGRVVGDVVVGGVVVVGNGGEVDEVVMGCEERVVWFVGDLGS